MKISQKQGKGEIYIWEIKNNFLCVKYKACKRSNLEIKREIILMTDHRNCKNQAIWLWLFSQGSEEPLRALEWASSMVRCMFWCDSFGLCMSNRLNKVCLKDYKRLFSRVAHIIYINCCFFCLETYSPDLQKTGFLNGFQFLLNCHFLIEAVFEYLFLSLRYSLFLDVLLPIYVFNLICLPSKIQVLRG